MTGPDTQSARRPVPAWTWGAGDDVCGICRNPFDGCPPDGRYPGDDSPVVWGTCSHAFHLQCIQKWLAAQTEQRCPICRRPWEFQAAADRAAGPPGAAAAAAAAAPAAARAASAGMTASAGTASAGTAAMSQPVASNG